MITAKTVKKFHGTEFKYQIEWMSAPVTCVMLVSEELGVSVKPVPTDEEYETFLADVAKEWKENRKDAIVRLQDPKFCIAKGGKTVYVKYLHEMIKTGDGSAAQGRAITCPFA
jgi:hypothetical protein